MDLFQKRLLASRLAVYNKDKTREVKRFGWRCYVTAVNSVGVCVCVCVQGGQQEVSKACFATFAIPILSKKAF